MCQVTVGVLGDICRAIEDGIYPYCDAVMQTLLTNLQACWRGACRCCPLGHAGGSGVGCVLAGGPLCRPRP